MNKSEALSEQTRQRLRNVGVGLAQMFRDRAAECQLNGSSDHHQVKMEAASAFHVGL